MTAPLEPQPLNVYVLECWNALASIDRQVVLLDQASSATDLRSVEEALRQLKSSSERQGFVRMAALALELDLTVARIIAVELSRDDAVARLREHSRRIAIELERVVENPSAAQRSSHASAHGLGSREPQSRRVPRMVPRSVPAEKTVAPGAAVENDLKLDERPSGGEVQASEPELAPSFGPTPESPSAVSPQLLEPDELSISMARFFTTCQQEAEYFVPEAEQLLRDWTAGVKSVGQEGESEDSLHRILRSTHTLKGSALMICCEPVGNIAARFQAAVGQYRDEGRSFGIAEKALFADGAQLVTDLIAAQGEPLDGGLARWLALTARLDQAQAGMLATDRPSTELPETAAPGAQASAAEPSATEEPATEVLTIGVPASEFPVTESSTDEFSTDEVPTDEVPTDEVPTDEVPTDEVPTDEASISEVPIEGVLVSEVPVTEVAVSKIPFSQCPATDVSFSESSGSETLVTAGAASEAPQIDAPATEPALLAAATEVLESEPLESRESGDLQSQPSLGMEVESSAEAPDESGQLDSEIQSEERTTEDLPEADPPVTPSFLAEPAPDPESSPSTESAEDDQPSSGAVVPQLPKLLPPAPPEALALATRETPNRPQWSTDQLISVRNLAAVPSAGPSGSSQVAEPIADESDASPSTVEEAASPVATDSLEITSAAAVREEETPESQLSTEMASFEIPPVPPLIPAAVARLRDVADGASSSAAAPLNEVLTPTEAAAAYLGFAGAALEPSATDPDPQLGPQAQALVNFFRDHKDVLEYFEPEVVEHLEGATEAVAALRRDGCSEELIHELFRLIHTLKGAAWSVGCVPMGQLAHESEELAVALREGGLEFSGAIGDTFQRVIETSRAMLYSGGRPLAALDRVLEKLATELEGHRRPLADDGPGTATDLSVVSATIASDVNGIAAQLEPHFESSGDRGEPGSVLRLMEPLATAVGRVNALTVELLADDAAAAFEPVNELCDRLQDVSAEMMATASKPLVRAARRFDELILDLSAPAVDGFGVDAVREGLEILQALATVRRRSELQPLSERLSHWLDEAASHEPSVERADESLAALDAQLAANVTSDGATLRVRLDRLDSLMNLLGEAVVSRTRVERLLGDLESSGQVLEFNRDRLASVVRQFGDDHSAPRLVGAPAASPAGRHAPAEGRGAHELERYDDFSLFARSAGEISDDVSEATTRLLSASGLMRRELAQLQRISRDLREQMSKVRMVPFGRLASRFRRLARKASVDFGKQVDLVIEGQAVEVDNAIFEHLVDAMLHLVQNAIAHGIESRQQRRELGKPEGGSVWLRAYHEGNSVFVEVEDDGAGLDLAELRRRAIAGGFRSLEQIELESEVDSAQLIFLPGLSTSSEITSAAGRGVGMDVVRAKLERIGGEIDIHTQKGLGTRFRFKLPLTLVVSEALMVRVAGSIFALPARAVRSVLRVEGDPFLLTEPCIEVQGEELPVLSSHRTLGIVRPKEEVDLFATVLRSGTARYALTVDEILGLEEVVVKPLDAFLSAAEHVSGASMSADGLPILFIDPVGLEQLAERVADLGEIWQEPTPAVEQPPSVLLADDSVSVRRIVGRMLEGAGLDVTTVLDGQEAIEAMNERDFDILISDLEMPRVNGYALIEYVRTESRCPEMPILVLSTRAGRRHFSLAGELGIRAFLTKPTPEKALIEAVREALGKPADKVSVGTEEPIADQVGR